MASALASHYKCGVNELPLSFAVSWLEQKFLKFLKFFLLTCENLNDTNEIIYQPDYYKRAVAQLLTCLSLGIQGIK